MGPIKGPAKLGEILASGRRWLPTHARMYARAMLGSETSPTAEDFTEAELDAIRALAGGYGSPENVTYRSYAPPGPGDPAPESYRNLYDKEQRDAVLADIIARHAGAGDATPMGTIFKTLGQFRVDETPEGDLRVRDVYNFNTPDVEIDEWTHNNGLWPLIRDLPSGKSSLYDVARAVGRKWGPQGSTVPGEDTAGMPIDFTIPRQYSWDRKRREEQAIVDALLK